MKPTIIKKLDEMELRAAALRQVAPPPREKEISWTGVLGWVFGLAEAGLLDYSSGVPQVIPGNIPFDVQYSVEVKDHPLELSYWVIEAGEVDGERAEAWSLALANGLWARLCPGDKGVGDRFVYGGTLCIAWRVLNDACHPESAETIHKLIEAWIKFGWCSERDSWTPIFKAARGNVKPNDPALIAAVMNYLFHKMEYAGGAGACTALIPNRSYLPYGALERGEDVNIYQFLNTQN